MEDVLAAGRIVVGDGAEATVTEFALNALKTVDA